MITNLADVIAAGLRRFAQMPPGVADALATQILRSAAELGHGGCDYYLPRHEHLSRPERNARIRAEYAAGASVSLLCRRYSLGRTQVYEIVRREQERAD